MGEGREGGWCGDERGQIRGLAGCEQVQHLRRAVYDEQDGLAPRPSVAVGDGCCDRLGVHECQFSPLDVKTRAVVSKAQIVIAQPLANVASQDRQAWHGYLAWADELCTERGVRHER